jgi:exodeoxyribonuclease VII small subunit
MKNNITFEKAFERLEKILQELNENKVSLEESITLFEEADGLISNCDSYLTKAEQKIETLIKNRNNDLVLDENNQPKTEKLLSNSSSYDNKNDRLF